MKFTRLLTLALVGLVLSLNTEAQTAGPLLWTSYIVTLGNFTRINSESTVVSRFTPGVAITVTRVQLQASQGSYIYPEGGKCSPLPKIRVTDGTTKYGLAIPNARGKGPYPKSVSADSGPIAVSFPANAALLLTVVPGETNCNPGDINITVHYSVN
jgi:hypothetical protein